MCIRDRNEILNSSILDLYSGSGSFGLECLSRGASRVDFCENYPPAMDKNAIFFGGTDPGRFVPTYMIYSAKVRPDIYLITQNALADNTYMNVMRDLYGDQIWIPTDNDSSLAFSQYLKAVQEGKISAGADVKTENGKVQIQGVVGVMEINAILCKQIFENNQLIIERATQSDHKLVGSAYVDSNPSDPPSERSFYIEESYPMKWMYPYLTPHGLIMKLNNEPTDLSNDLIKQDNQFWDWYCKRLLSDKKFLPTHPVPPVRTMISLINEYNY